LLPQPGPPAAMFGVDVDDPMTRGSVMIYNTDDSVIGVELARLRSRRRQAERMSISQEVLPAIKVNIGEWYVDALDVRTREITARE
jgi:hypothetical protein